MIGLFSPDFPKVYGGNMVLPVTSSRYIIIDLLGQVLVFSKKDGSERMIDLEQNSFWTPVVLFNDNVWLFNSDLKKVIEYDILKDERNIVFEDTFFSGRFMSDKKVIFKNTSQSVSCVDVFSKETIWKLDFEDRYKCDFPSLQIGNKLVCNVPTHEYKVIRDFSSGDKLGSIDRTSFEKLNKFDSLGNTYNVAGNIIGHDKPPSRDTVAKEENWKWFSINSTTFKLNWMHQLHYPLIYKIHNNNLYSIYFDHNNSEYTYYVVDLLTGKAIIKEPIHNHLLKYQGLEDNAEAKANFIFSAPVVSQKFFFFGFGTHILKLDKSSFELLDFYKSSYFYYQALITDDYMIYTTKSFQTIIFKNGKSKNIDISI